MQADDQRDQQDRAGGDQRQRADDRVVLREPRGRRPGLPRAGALGRPQVVDEAVRDVAALLEVEAVVEGEVGERRRALLVPAQRPGGQVHQRQRAREPAEVLRPLAAGGGAARREERVALLARVSPPGSRWTTTVSVASGAPNSSAERSCGHERGRVLGDEVLERRAARAAERRQRQRRGDEQRDPRHRHRGMDGEQRPRVPARDPARPFTCTRHAPVISGAARAKRAGTGDPAGAHAGPCGASLTLKAPRMNGCTRQK